MRCVIVAVCSAVAISLALVAMWNAVAFAVATTARVSTKTACRVLPAFFIVPNTKNKDNNCELYEPVDKGPEVIETLDRPRGHGLKGMPNR